MKRQMLAVGAIAVALAACDSFKEAMTAHVDVVARAGSQELSVTRLGDLLGNASVPLQAQNAKEIAHAVTNLWVDYQLLGQAAAKGDSLADPKRIDDALWLQVANLRAQKWHDQLVKSRQPAPAGNDEARYNQGDMLAARHILFAAPAQGMTPAARDSVRKLAEKVRSQATPANFAQLAQQYSNDPGSKVRGGALGIFPRGAMVPEFDRALAALKPGEISPLVETQFGYHIIYRQPYAEVKDEFAGAASQGEQQRADSIWLDGLEKNGNIVIKPNAAKDIRAAAADLDANRSSKTVVATSKAGDLTVGRVVQWIESYPARANVPQQLATAPDSIMPLFLKNILQKELVMRQADSAKVQIDTADLNQLHHGFSSTIVSIWNGLGITPKGLADSAKGADAKERLAASRVESYIDALVSQKANFVEVPKPVEIALRNEFETKVNEQGIDRAVERALRTRAAADSARGPQAPSAVPMPGAPAGPQGATPQGAPQGAAPQGAAPQGAPQSAPAPHP